MSQAPEPSIVIKQLLAEELAALRNFVDILAKEQDALKAGGADRLPEISQSKIELASKLSSILRQRESALAALGFGPGKIGMASWLDALDASSKLPFAASWAQLLTLAETCQREHALNGKLIAIQLVQTQQALTALTAASGLTLTYGPDGQQSQPKIGGGRALGSA
jgi:flagellar biosynthesis/type III secretory pathway chaperone